MADKHQQQGLRGPDGFIRTIAQERRLNQLFEATFATPAGQEVLRHLRSITIEAVGGPNVTDAELRHREGQRFLVAIIEQRIKRAHHPHDDSQDA